jgi:hypothetical protein
MGGSAGSPLVRALTDHPDVFHKHRVVELSVFKDPKTTFPNIIFTLAP